MLIGPRISFVVLVGVESSLKNVAKVTKNVTEVAKNVFGTKKRDRSN